MKFTVEHLGLPASNAAALRDWYQAQLGATCITPNGSEPPFFVSLPGTGPMLEIYTATGMNPQTSDNGLAGWRHLALCVDSIESARKELESRGVEFMDPAKPAAGGGNVLFFKDGEGNLLHLVERPGDSEFSR